MISVAIVVVKWIACLLIVAKVIVALVATAGVLVFLVTTGMLDRVFERAQTVRTCWMVVAGLMIGFWGLFGVFVWVVMKAP